MNETISMLAQAARKRHRDAQVLHQNGRNAGAIYLFGYVAEMHLKVGAAKTRRARPTDSIHSYLTPLREHVRRTNPSLDCSGGHGLVFWAIPVATVQPRVHRDRLMRAARYLDAAWDVSLRYRPDTMTARDVWMFTVQLGALTSIGLRMSGRRS
jgi:hypothetical protein